MPLIKPRTRGKQLVKHRTRLDCENNETLYAYAQFLGESTEYVLNQVIDTVLARDKEFVKWRESHQGSYVPRVHDRSRRKSVGARRADHGVAPSFAAGRHTGARAIAEERHADAETDAADDYPAQQERSDVQLGQVILDHEVDADRADDNCRAHDLHHRPVSQQKLPDDDCVFCHLPLLEEEAEENAGEQAKEQFLG